MAGEEPGPRVYSSAVDAIVRRALDAERRRRALRSVAVAADGADARRRAVEFERSQKVLNLADLEVAWKAVGAVGRKRTRPPAGGTGDGRRAGGHLLEALEAERVLAREDLRRLELLEADRAAGHLLLEFLARVRGDGGAL